MIGLHVYPVDESIADFDLNTDIEEYNYDGRVVFRGNMDPEYSTETVKVYWLYDDSNKRIGLVEHTDASVHTCLWYRDNVFSTMLQEDWSVYDESVWNIMNESAYDDCMRRGYSVNDLKNRTQSIQIITPDDIYGEIQSRSNPCIRCSSTNLHPGCVVVGSHSSSMQKDTLFDMLFVDHEGTIYIPPWDSKVYATLRRRGAAAETADALPAPPDTTGGGATSTTSCAGGSTTGYEASSSSSSSSAANAARALPGGGADEVSPSS